MYNPYIPSNVEIIQIILNNLDLELYIRMYVCTMRRQPISILSIVHLTYLNIEPYFDQNTFPIRPYWWLRYALLWSWDIVDTFHCYRTLHEIGRGNWIISLAYCSILRVFIIRNKYLDVQILVPYSVKSQKWISSTLSE